eukprot:SAG22_NODE_1225_length_5115_cov_1.965510_6_plen_109_part_00
MATVLPNKMEIAGSEDMPIISSYSSTMAWTCGLGCASALSFLKQLTGSWIPLLGIPAVLRCIGTALYYRYVTVKPLREYLALPPADRRAYLDAQELEPTTFASREKKD